MAFSSPISTNISAGTLQHWIVIVKPTLAQDSAGGWAEDAESRVAAVRAQVLALTGRELYAAQQQVSEVTHQITMRYLPGITANMNVWFRGRQFRIQAAVDPDETRKVLVMLCLERNNSARDAGGAAI